MKKHLLPLIIIFSLALTLLCGCGASLDKAQEYYDDLKGYVDDARDVVDGLGEKAGDAIKELDGLLSGNAGQSGSESTAPTAGSYTFRTQELFDQHYQKHGAEFGNVTQSEYLALANALISNPDALTKTDDGDTLYYDKAKNEFAVLSGDGFIRTFFKPDDGMDYWDRQ